MILRQAVQWHACLWVQSDRKCSNRQNDHDVQMNLKSSGTLCHTPKFCEHRPFM